MIRNVLLRSLISLFFCCSLPHPSPTKPHTDDTWEPSRAETGRHIIPYYQIAGKGQDPPDPLDTTEQIVLLECGLRQVKRSTRVKKAPWHHSCPLCCTVSFNNVCWQKSDNNFGSCTVFCLAVLIIFTERTSLLIKPSL